MQPEEQRETEMKENEQSQRCTICAILSGIPKNTSGSPRGE